MADGGNPKARRFSAFVSYSSKDVAFVRRLHKSLETYRLPKHLRRSKQDLFPPERLKPLFRDLDELTASFDLTRAIREALEQSDFLIVVCSPSAAQSEWVGREIEYFRSLRGDDRILPALIDGTPATAFPAALVHVSEGRRVEPLAADFRPEGGSRRLAMLKLIAPLAGVELDQLIHRDGQRQQRRTLAMVGGAMAATAVVGVLTELTLTARAETERKRQQATGLVDHMLTDVRRNLQRTGRLDQLASVNESAMAYYRSQDLAHLTDDELRQRAKLLQAMGEDDEKRGNLEKARSAFVEAHRTTAKLLSAKPNDTERIFAHAQSEYWVGFINWRNGDGAEAQRRYEAYAKLAQRLVELAPGNGAFRAEVGYAAVNLGILTLRQAGDLDSAKSNLTQAIAAFKESSRLAPREQDNEMNIANAYGWLGECGRVAGRYSEARAARSLQREILLRRAEQDPANNQLKMEIAYNDFAFVRIEAGEGREREALGSLERNIASVKAISQTDPGNAKIKQQLLMLELISHTGQFQSKQNPSSFRELPKDLARNCDSAVLAGVDVELVGLCLSVGVRRALSRGDRRLALKLVDEMDQKFGKDNYTKRWGFNFRREIIEYRTILGS